jgi:hypothetical protein
MTEIGTSRLAPSPDTMVAGWWSPSITTTRSSSPYVVKKVKSASREYSIDWP